MTEEKVTVKKEEVKPEGQAKEPAKGFAAVLDKKKQFLSKNKKFSVIGGVVIIAIILIILALIIVPKIASPYSKTVLSVVDGKEITYGDVQKYAKYYALISSRYDYFDDKLGTQNALYLQQETLGFLEEKIVVEKWFSENKKVEKNPLETSIKEIVKSLTLTDDAKKIMKKVEFDEKILNDFATFRYTLKTRWSDVLKDKVKNPTEKEMKAFYKEQKKLYPEQYKDKNRTYAKTKENIKAQMQYNEVNKLMEEYKSKLIKKVNEILEVFDKEHNSELDY